MKTALTLMLLALPVVTQAQTFQSAPGESMDSFVLSIKSDVSKLSKSSGHVEVCGGIAKVDDRYTVTMTTGKTLECWFDKPEGYTGVSLHTHPKEASNGFSEADYASGRGYLIERGFVYYQDGKGTSRRVFKSH